MSAWWAISWPACVAFADAQEQPAALVVQITAPSDGASVSGVQEIVITTSDDARIAQVAVYKDEALLDNDTRPPFRVTWDTRLEPDGPHTLKAIARDLDRREGFSSPVTARVDHTPPKVTFMEPQDGSVLLGTVALKAEASDANGIERVRFLLDGVVIGGAEHPPYRWNWDSLSVHSGFHTLQVRAIDVAGNSTASAPATVRVANLNRAPVLSPIGPQTAREGEPLAFSIQASDPDGEREPLTYRAARLPAWAAFDLKTATFQGTPGYQEASFEHPEKIYEGVRLEVCDAEPRCSSETITIRVLNVNRPPTLEPLGDKTLKEGEPLNVTLVASDPEGDALTCTARSLPAWVQFDPATCTAQGVPGPQVASEAEPTTPYPPVAFEVCDPEPLCASHTMGMTVTNVNRAPVWHQIRHHTVEEGGALYFDVLATDPDGDSLTLTAFPLPEGASFHDRDHGRGAFGWETRLDQGGQYEATVQATDGTLTTQGTVTITVREKSLAISGRIHDDSGTPLQGATVEIRRGIESVRQAKTDAEGLYLAAGLSRGTYLLRPSYQPEEPFSSVARTPVTAGFNPTQQKVMLTDHDERDVNFQASVSR